jgi:hypothetical protein
MAANEATELEARRAREAIEVKAREAPANGVIDLEAREAIGVEARKAAAERTRMKDITTRATPIVFTLAAVALGLITTEVRAVRSLLEASGRSTTDQGVRHRSAHTQGDHSTRRRERRSEF